MNGQRNIFATAAMQAIVTKYQIDVFNPSLNEGWVCTHAEFVASLAFAFADAMMIEAQKEPAQNKFAVASHVAHVSSQKISATEIVPGNTIKGVYDPLPKNPNADLGKIPEGAEPKKKKVTKKAAK